MNDTRGTYKIIRKLGEGGGGIVYLAYHSRLKKEVVLKQIKNSQKKDYNTRREVDILKGLNHTYLPQVYDFINIDGKSYIVMSYIPGKSFQELVKEGYRFTQNQLIRWGLQLCSALDYLHNQNPPIVHSDIKPSNIMLTPEGNICLIDFNISFFMDGTKMIGYSHGYSSPEQRSIVFDKNLQDIVLDDKTDIYSLGAVFFFMITRRKVNEFNDPEQCRLLLENRVTEAFSSVICKAISFDKADRFQSAYEMYKALQNISKKDKRYIQVTRAHRISMILCSVLLAINIVLLGLGVHQMKQDKLDKYDELIQQQTSYRKKGLYKKQTKIYQEASELMPDQLESYYQNALSMYEQGLYKDCIEFISTNIEQNNDLDSTNNSFADVYYVKARCYFELEQYGTSVDNYKKLFQCGSSNYLHYRDYAITLAYNKDDSKANEILQQAINKGMKEDDIYYAKGEINNAMNKDNEAISCFKSCLHITVDDELKERSYVLLSDIYKKQGNLADCRTILMKAMNDLPSSRQLISIERLIQANIDLGDKTGNSQYEKEAVQLLKEVINKHWDNYATYDNLVVINEKLGNYNEVRSCLSLMKENYGEDYNIYKRYAFLEIDLQKQKNEESRDYSQFANYYKKAKALYQKEKTDDAEMQLLDTVYQDVMKGGWLS